MCVHDNHTRGRDKFGPDEIVASSCLCYNQYSLLLALIEGDEECQEYRWEETFVPANIGYLYAAIFLAAGFILAIVATLLSNIISPHKRTKEKLQTYESGESIIGTARVQYPLGFYIFALLFVAFDVDIVFIAAWAIIFKPLGLFGFIEITFFIIVLALGLVYAWRKGVTRWI